MGQCCLLTTGHTLRPSGVRGHRRAVGQPGIHLRDRGRVERGGEQEGLGQVLPGRVEVSIRIGPGFPGNRWRSAVPCSRPWLELPIRSANAEAERTFTADPQGHWQSDSTWSKAASPSRRLPAISECPGQHFIDDREHSRTNRVASSLERHQSITERRQRGIKSRSGASSDATI